MKIHHLSFLLVLFFLNSCKSLEDLVTFNLNHTTTFVVPGSTGLNLPVNIPTPEVSSSSSQAFENNGTRANLVKNVTLETLTLTIQSPTNQTFGFIKSIKVYISADGQQEVLIAEIDDIPQNSGGTINLETTGANLDSYIKSESYNLRNAIVVREVVGNDVEIRANLGFKVTADLL